MRIEHSVEIGRPVDAVFAFLSDPANLPQWQSGLLEVTKEPGPEGVGARHREVRSKARATRSGARSVALRPTS